MNDQEFLTDEELHAHILHVIENYKGDGSLLNEAVGLILVGRIMGWEHQRIVSTRVVWTFCTKVFGDPKRLMPKRTAIGQRKSTALHIVDKLDAAGELMKGYLDVVTRKVSIPKAELRVLDG